MTEDVRDVSSYQGRVDWAAEKQLGISAGICKATEGTWYRDAYFAWNWAQIRAQGLHRGAYHFLKAGASTAAQVDYFLAMIDANGGLVAGDSLWCDSEEPNVSGAAGRTRDFMRVLDQRLADRGAQVKTGIYTAPWYVSGNGGPGVWQPLTGWPLWSGGPYQSAPPGPATWAPWARPLMWQNTDHFGVGDASIIETPGFFTHAPPAPTPPPNGALHMNSLCVIATPSPDPAKPGVVISAYAIGKDGNAYTCWQAEPTAPFGPWINFGGDFPSK